MNKKQKKFVIITILILAVLFLICTISIYLKKNNPQPQVIENNTQQGNADISHDDVLELVKAVKVSDFLKVQELIKAGADVNEKDVDNKTVLMWAVESAMCNPEMDTDEDCIKSISIIKALIEAGANVNAKDKDSKTALMWTFGNPRIIQELIKAGADINAKDSNGQTALMHQYHYAMFPFGVYESVMELINAGADVNIKDNSGWTALLSASMKEGDSLAELINAGANVNVKDSNGKTALMYASMMGNLGMVKELITAGADVNAEDKNGEIVLMYASTYENSQTEEIIKILKNAGWKKYKNDIFGFELEYPSTGSGIPEIETYDCDVEAIMRDCHGSQKGESKNIVNLNNVPFCFTETSQAAAGTSYNTYNYITTKNNQCLSVSFVIAASCGGVGGGSGPEHDQCLKYEPFMINEITAGFKIVK